MTSSEKGKKLCDLLVIELRTYLKQRQLDHIGTKTVLAERLHQALISEGKDPNTYIFTNEDNSVNMETLKEKEQTSVLDENTNQFEEESPVLEIDATNFEETPMEIETTGNDSVEPPAEIKVSSVPENADDKMELQAEINESFVLMIDELISEKFLEETQNGVAGEPDFVDTNDLGLNEGEQDKEENAGIGFDDGPDEDPLNVETSKTEEEKSNQDSTTISSSEVEEITNESNVQKKVCNKELIVVVKRENFFANKRKLFSQQSDENENIFMPNIKIKEEVIILSDDEMNGDENIDSQIIKEESTENSETNESKIGEVVSNGENEETKSDGFEQEEILPNGHSYDCPHDKGNTAKQGIYSLKIENLISSVKAQELRQLLCNYAKVLEVRVFHDNKKIYCHAFAKVEVSDLDEMLEKLNALEYKGTVLSVTKINEQDITAVNEETKSMRSIKGLQRKKQETGEKIESKEMERNLWVTNLLQNTKAQDIKQLFSKHAKVIGVKVVKSSSNPSKNCYGYVTLESRNDVDVCIQKLDRTTFNGRVIRLSATKKAPVLDSVTDKGVKKSPEKDIKGSNNLKPSDKKKTLETTPKKSDVLQNNDDKRSDSKKDTYEKSRSDCERHQREIDRIRLEEERARQDVEQARELLRRQREEARLLEREREKIRKEREYLERQRMEMLRMERERQRIEREKIEKEKEELRRQQQKLQEARRAEKRASSSSSSNKPSKRAYVSPKREKSKKNEANDFPKRSSDFLKENDDAAFLKRHGGEYSKRIDKYSKRTEDYQKRSEDYPKRSSDYHKRQDDYPKRTEMYPRRGDDYPKRVTEDFPKRFDHYTKPEELYAKEDYHKRPEFVNYKREDRPLGVDFKREFSGHSSHHAPSAANNSGYKFETYHSDRDKMLRQPARKDIPAKEAKSVGYNDRNEITSTEAYRSILREDRDRERKSGIDYSYKNDNRMPLLKETPRYKDDGSPWAAGVTPVKTFRDSENTNTPKDPWWRKWDGQWSAGTSTEYPGVNYNSGPACPPPPGLNTYPMNNHFGNYRKY